MSSKHEPTVTEPPRRLRSVLILVAPLLILLFAALFFPLFQSGVVHFANDGPYGTAVARPYQVPDSLNGIWNDLLWLGAWNGNYNPNLTGLSIAILGPGLYQKMMICIGMIFVGLTGAICFHRLGFPRWVAVLGALAASLNMNAFSNACWGLPSRAQAMGAAFLAVAAFHSSYGRFPVIKAILAGLAIGLSITEGGDNGAIFAIVVGCYGFFSAFLAGDPLGRRAFKGAWRVAVAAIVAGVFAAQTLNIFVNTAVKGVVGISDNQRTPAEKWDFATQGSLHPKETLRVIIPGLFGYRMDAEDGGNYWGRVGESLSAPGVSRHSGAGEYAGVLVVLVALWGLHQSLKRGGTFTNDERKRIWFWGFAALACLLLAWGKWGPLYRLLYALPYFNAIRLPLKWMHPFHLALLILFGYGLAGFGRLYLSRAANDAPSSRNGFKAARRAVHPDERRWIWFCLILVAASLLGALVYTGSQQSLIRHLTQANVMGDPAKMAAFSIREVWLYFLFLLLSAGLIIAIVTGQFSKKIFHLAVFGLGLVLVADLVRADRHWMLFFNYLDRYALNPPLQHLKEYSTAYRVAKVPQRPIMLALRAAAQANQTNAAVIQEIQQQAELFQTILDYTHDQWQQNHFQFYNIPCLDMSQEPRLPGDKLAFNQAMAAAAGNGHATREYIMTSTRHFVGLAGSAGVLNAYLDSALQRFREVSRFSLVSTRPNSPFYGDLRVQADTNGPFAIIEFTGALPRAHLFHRWEVSTNESQTLARLAAADMDPAETLVVNDAIPAGPGSTNALRSEATIAPQQTSHRVNVQVNAAAAGVLLLTDRYDPAWKVTVDGQPAQLLRCNYIMRGVQVPAGAHSVEFSYHPDRSGFWLMAGCDALGLALLVFIGFARKKR